jgi:plasmid stabilization system protein ParE
MKLRYTVQTLARLDAIFLRLLEENPFAARRYRKQIGRALDRLRRFPSLGSRVPEFPKLPLRQVILDPYRLFYYVDEANDTVWIVGAWHGAQIPVAPRLPMMSTNR